jgi:hypothetical protein
VVWRRTVRVSGGVPAAARSGAEERAPPPASVTSRRSAHAGGTRARGGAVSDTAVPSGSSGAHASGSHAGAPPAGMGGNFAPAGGQPAAAPGDAGSRCHA